ARIHAMATLTAGYQLARGATRFDPDASVSAGALVFRRRIDPEVSNAEGSHFAGSILVMYPSYRPGEFDPEQVLRAAAHERVHALQYDQAYLLWGAALDAAAARWAGLPD